MCSHDCLHVVQSRRNEAHERHEEEGDLQHRVLNEGEAIDQFIIPIGSFEIDEETKCPDEDSYGNDLSKSER